MGLETRRLKSQVYLFFSTTTMTKDRGRDAYYSMCLEPEASGSMFFVFHFFSPTVPFRSIWQSRVTAMLARDF
jgi:hypothetical protein